jgi:putative two-component system response regulator
MSGLLKDHYRVKVANSGEKALKIVRGGPAPDLILLDIMMPRMVGSDVAARLRADSHLNTVPIVFLSAAGGKWVAEHQAAAGDLPLIAKPASVDEVLEGIEKELSKRRPIFAPLVQHGAAGPYCAATTATQ